MTDLHPRYPITTVVAAGVVLLALSSCQVNAGRGLLLGDKKTAPVSQQPAIAWNSWSEATRVMKENQRAVLLYVEVQSNVDAQSKFDPAIFGLDEVRQSCSLLTCVSAGAVSARFENTPTKEAFIAAIHKSIEAPANAPQRK